MTTYCSECDRVHSDTRKAEPWRWRCLAMPVAPGYGFVSPNYSPTPPYQLCKFHNTDGACHDFSPLRQTTTTEE